MRSSERFRASIRRSVRAIPVVGQALESSYWRLVRRARRFPGTVEYWEHRYAQGGNSGPGSAGHLAAYKAHWLNSFTSKNDVSSVIEFGCGDGTQLELLVFPDYVGIDVAPTAIELCTQRFKSDKTKRFLLLDKYNGETAELSLSIDVIYHLVEDHIFEEHLRNLFNAATRYVVIYGIDRCEDPRREVGPPHVRRRPFVEWARHNAPDWRLIRVDANPYPHDGDSTQGSEANFYVFVRCE